MPSFWDNQHKKRNIEKNGYSLATVMDVGMNRTMTNNELKDSIELWPITIWKILVFSIEIMSSENLNSFRLNLTRRQNTILQQLGLKVGWYKYIYDYLDYKSVDTGIHFALTAFSSLSFQNRMKN